ncbi:hypothetical protein [Mycoplasmopsis agalactiae]|uniref:hypothetical protein n=1 Tax=Mycoplasmopsis agalactiae TaxID=2110 RepID=UPI001F15D0BB|nr:hypothetical protein [Mycoplasmopsis agalactiae]
MACKHNKKKVKVGTEELELEFGKVTKVEKTNETEDKKKKELEEKKKRELEEKKAKELAEAFKKKKLQKRKMNILLQNSKLRKIIKFEKSSF